MEEHPQSEQLPRPAAIDWQAQLGCCEALVERGRTLEAEGCLRQLLSLRPNSADMHCRLADLLSIQGRESEAATHYRQAALLQPQSALPFYLLGNLLRASQPAESESCYRRAIELEAGSAGAYCNLGSLLAKQGRLGEGEVCYRAAIAVEPNLAEAHNNLGKALRRQRRLTEAEDSYRRAIGLKENVAECHYNLGEVLLEQNRLEDAATSLWRCIALRPDFAEGYGRLGQVFMRLGHEEKAESFLRQAIQHRPGLTAAIYDLALLLCRRGRLDQAVDAFREVLRLNPGSAHTWVNLGSLLGTQGKAGEEERCYHQALQLRPDLAAAHSNLGNILKKQGKLEQAREHYDRAIALQPNFSEAVSNLGALLQHEGLLTEAEACYRRALAIAPDAALVRSNLLNCLMHAETDPRTLFAEHRLYGEHFAHLAVSDRVYANVPDPERILQIGFVSCDFHDHPIPTLFEPILAHLATERSLALHAFVSQTIEDEACDRIRRHFPHWHRVAHLSDAALAENISSAAIDILIDLTGHMAGNRLLTFAHKPAPLQASWIGYIGTTGLPTVDYYFADRFELPLTNFSDHFVEKLVHLPAAVSYRPRDGAPSVNALPALTNGYVTFGNLNRASKLTPATISLWARLMLAVPSSRLLLANMPARSVAERICDRLAAAGVERERVNVELTCDPFSYLRLLHEVDICLDPFPFTGLTTTLDSIWMGCPTLTIPGCTPPGMQSTAVLAHMGLYDFVASDEDDFVAKGLSLSGDLKALADVRSDCRERLRQSTIGRPEAIAVGLTVALRHMWRRWCDGSPPEAIDCSI